ncbi:putative mariner transposase [Trichonephila clavipes]|nr:putative mariner transposase [Trichonephila clavipes]
MVIVALAGEVYARDLMPLKTRRVDRVIHVKSVRAHYSPVGLVHEGSYPIGLVRIGNGIRYRCKWCKRFNVGRESTEDDQHPGRLVTVSGVETVTKINHIVRADRRMSIRMIVEAVNADKETVRKILHEELITHDKSLCEVGVKKPD